MTAPEDQNGLREALARAEAERDAALKGQSEGLRSLIAEIANLVVKTDTERASLIAERDTLMGQRDELQGLIVTAEICAERAIARARAAEAEITRLKEEMEAALAKAFDAGFDISAEGWNAEHGVDRPEDDEGYRIACERAVARLLATLSPKEHPHG